MIEEPKLPLSVIEAILRRERSVVAEDDVAGLMLAFYEAADARAPHELQNEATHYQKDCDEDCVWCHGGRDDGDHGTDEG